MVQKFIKTILTIVFISIHSYADDNDNDLNPYRFWGKVRFSISDVERSEILSKDCYKDSKHLFACVRVIDTLGQFLKPQVRIIPENLYNELSNQKTTSNVQKKIGNFLLVEVLSDTEQGAKENQSLAQYIQAKKSDHKKLWDSIEKVIMENNQDLRFPELISELKSKIIFQDVNNYNIPEGYIATVMYNALLQEIYDPHTGLVSKEQIDDIEKNPGTQFVGIGVELSLIKKQFVIRKTFENGPAEKAGILPEDIIIEVNGESVVNKSYVQVLSSIRGNIGETVQLTVLRNGKKINLEVTRDKIATQNVSTKILQNISSKVGYIKLSTFMDPQACEKVRDSLIQLQSQHVSSLIFDLRENTGGRVDVAACIGGLFVGAYKEIAKIYDYKSTQPTPFMGKYLQVTQLPLAVLINERSASASELLSGALQDYKRAWVVGERSYGKGTSQMVRDFPADRNLLFKLTTNRFYLPSGRTNQIVGITPDFTVAFKPNATAEEREAEREEDSFNLLPSGEAWVQTRPEQVQKISNCLESKQQAVKLYQDLKDQNKAPDYQVLSAEEVLQCEAQTFVQDRENLAKNVQVSSFRTYFYPYLIPYVQVSP